MERYYFYCDFDFGFDIYALLEAIKSFQKYDFDTKILFDNLIKQILETENEKILCYYYGKNKVEICPKGNEEFEFVDLDLLFKEDKFYLPEDAYFVLKVNRTDDRFKITLKDMSGWLWLDVRYEIYKFPCKRHIKLFNNFSRDKIFDILSNNLRMIFNYKVSYSKEYDVSTYWKNKFKNNLLLDIMYRAYDKQTLIYFYKLKNPIPIVPNGNIRFVDLDKLLDGIEHKPTDKFCLPEDTYITLSILENCGLYSITVEDVSKWLNDEDMNSKEDKK